MDRMLAETRNTILVVFATVRIVHADRIIWFFLRRSSLHHVMRAAMSLTPSFQMWIIRGQRVQEKRDLAECRGLETIMQGKTTRANP